MLAPECLAGLACGPGWYGGLVMASTQAPFRRARPRPIRLRRFSAAVRRLSQALFWSVRGSGA